MLKNHVVPHCSNQFLINYPLVKISPSLIYLYSLIYLSQKFQNFILISVLLLIYYPLFMIKTMELDLKIPI